MAYPKITKTKYKEYINRLNDAQNSGNFDAIQVAHLTKMFLDVFKYDPEMKTKSSEQLQKEKDYLQRKKDETGLSTYQLQNRSKYYQENKERLIEKRLLKKQIKST
jgi:hypothetical protein